MRAKPSNCERVNSRFVAVGLVCLVSSGQLPIGFCKKKAAPAATQQPAASLREQVQKALSQTDFAGAEKLLDDSIRQSPTPEKLFLLALLLKEQKKDLEAADLFRRFMADTGGAQEDDLRVAREALLAQKMHAGEVVVEGDRGSMVFVDNRPVGVLPLAAPLLLSPGLHKIALSLGNKRLEEQHKVLASRVAELRFNLSSDVVVATLQKAALLVVSQSPQTSDPASALTAQEIASIEQATKQVNLGKSLGLQTQAIALLAAPQLANCVTEERCQFSLAEENQANWLLSVRALVTPAKRGTKEVRLQLSVFDPAILEPAATVEKTCVPCDAETVRSKTAELLNEGLDAALRRPRGTLVVHSVPDVTHVRLGNRVLGQTPLRRPVWAGTYPLVLRKPGFSPLQREITVEAGQRQTVELTLMVGNDTEEPSNSVSSVPPAAKTGPLVRPKWRIGVGATAIGLGAIALGFGISALAVNSYCVSSLSDPVSSCPQIYDTVVPGAALSAVGGAALITGTLLLAWPP